MKRGLVRQTAFFRFSRLNRNGLPIDHQRSYVPQEPLQVISKEPYPQVPYRPSPFLNSFKSMASANAW